MRAVENIILWKEVSQKLLDELHIQTELLTHTADGPFAVLKVTQEAMTGTMDYCSTVFLVDSVTEYIFSMQSILTKQACRNSISSTNSLLC